MNVIIIDTPHQVLNAIEAREAFELGAAHFVIMLSEEYPAAAFIPLINEQECQKVTWIHINSALVKLKQLFPKSGPGRLYCHYLIQAIRRKRLDQIAKEIGETGTLVLGNYLTDYMRHFAAVLRYGTLCLLDDGTATIAANRKRWMEEIGEGEQKRKGIGAVKSRIVASIIRFRDLNASNVTFFTTYDLETRKSDRLIKNQYKYLKSLATESKELPEIFFLGQTICEDGDLRSTLYLEYLAKVKDYFKGMKLVYIQHKRERKEKVEQIREKVGIQVRRFDVPIEYQMIVRGTRPKMLAGFFSSALETCRVIFGEYLKVVVFYIDPTYFIKDNAFVRDVYADFEGKVSSTFEMVNIS